MNCRDFEKRIYLYRELSATEIKLMDEHMAQCGSCRAIASGVHHHQQLIEKVRLIKPVIKDPEWLTQRIMNSVEGRERPASLLNAMASFFDHLFVRYAFGALSILLIAFFFIEQQDMNHTQPVAKVEIKQGAILDTGSFLKMHVKSRQNRQPTISISRYSHLRSERVVKTL